MNFRILFFQQRNWGINIGSFLARKFYDIGHKVSALTFKDSTNFFIKRQKNIKYDLIYDHEEILSDPEKFLENDNFTLKEICRDYNIDSIWPLIQSSRNHVRSYKDKYYYSFKQNVSDEQIITYIKAVHKLIKKIENEFNPDFIIAPNFVSYVHIAFNLYFKNKNVKMLGLTGSLNDLNIFTYSYLDDNLPMIDRYHELEKGSISENYNKAKNIFNQKLSLTSARILKIRKKSRVKIWLSFVKNFIKLVFKNLKLIFTKKKKSFFSLDNTNVYYFVRDFIYQEKYKIFSDNFEYDNLDQLNNFAYFPLQFQPEANIDIGAVNFNNQLETLRLVAQNLPDDMTLVVKDHPAMYGFRSPSFIQKIIRTPNVKLINPNILGLNVLKKSKLLIASTGTSFFEAAVLKIESIHLGDIGLIDILPNTEKINNFYDLPKKIKYLEENMKFDEEYNKKVINYISASLDVGFDLKYQEIWNKNIIDYENLNEIFIKFKKEVEQNVDT